MAIQIIDDLSCIRIVNGAQSLLINKPLVKTIDTPDNDTVRIDIGEGVLRHVYIRLSDVTVPAGLADVNALREFIKGMLDTDTAGGNPTLDNQLLGLQLLTDIKALNDAANDLLTNIKDGQITGNGLMTNIKDSNNTANTLLTDIKTSQAGQSTLLTNLQTGQAAQTGVLNDVRTLVTAEQSELQSMTGILGDIYNVLNAQSNTAFNEPLRIDESKPNMVYYGYAVPGTSDDTAAWAIKCTTREGEMVTTTWANGNQQFTNKWANRYTVDFSA